MDQAHTPQEAVAHVRAKYEHFKAQIETPEDFIRLAATKSLLTGQPYLVRTREGQEMPLSTWLSNYSGNIEKMKRSNLHLRGGSPSWERS
jgi:hypothetical protein